ncbi:MAG: M56 family metallopeptidase, partial [Bacteroidota bacterium]
MIDEYLIKVSACWALFYMLYFLLLRKETFFQENRIYLLFSLLVSLVFPFLPLGGVGSGLLPEAFLPAININAEAVVNVEKSAANLLAWGYWIGVSFMGLRFLLSLWKLDQIRSASTVSYTSGIREVRSDLVESPFSFFRTLYLPVDMVENDEAYRQIITHERVHIQEFHSLDLILAELLAIFFWFNPFIFWYKKSIQHIHEYLADEAVLRVANRKHYHQTLLEQAVPGLSLGHHFSQSQLKNRFDMMKRV